MSELTIYRKDSSVIRAVALNPNGTTSDVLVHFKNGDYWHYENVSDEHRQGLITGSFGRTVNAIKVGCPASKIDAAIWDEMTREIQCDFSGAIVRNGEPSRYSSALWGQA